MTTNKPSGTWIKANIMTIVLASVLAWVAVQQTELQVTQRQTHNIIEKMVEKVDIKCSSLEDRMYTLEAKDIHKEAEITAIKEQLKEQRLWFDEIRNMRTRGGGVSYDYDSAFNQRVTEITNNIKP